MEADKIRARGMGLHYLDHSPTRISFPPAHQITVDRAIWEDALRDLDRKTRALRLAPLACIMSTIAGIAATLLFLSLSGVNL